MKKISLALVLILVFMLFFSALPASISADPEGGGSVDVYPGAAECTTKIKIHAWNAEGAPIVVLVVKFSGTWEELLELGESTSGEGILPLLVYGTIPNEGLSKDSEGVFIIDSNDWYKSIYLTLKKGHYFVVVIPIIEGEGGTGPDNFITKEFNVSGSCKKEETIPWVRNVEMACSQVWINEANNFEFVFFWEYKNNNWVKIYDMAGNEVFSIDMPYGNAHFEADLPNGMYTVKTFNDNFEKPIQEFVIGKP